MNVNAPSQFIIRQMRVDDIDAVHAIEVNTFPLPWTKRSYLFDLQENPASRMWVAELQMDSQLSRIVGLFVAWFIIDEAHIGNIAVEESFRGQGIGKHLLSYALDRLRYEGAERFSLEVRVSNLPAQALYRQSGFRKVGVRRRYYHDNQEDALIMVLDETRKH